MMKRMLPITISLILALSVVVFAIVTQDATVKGLRITSESDGVTLKIKQKSDPSLSDTVDLGADLTLKPCSYEDGVFYDGRGNVVTNNPDYVKQVQIQVMTDAKCNVYATKKVTGTIPIGVVCEQKAIDTDTEVTMVQSISTLTFYAYVDAENYTANGTADVEVVLHGEPIE